MDLEQFFAHTALESLIALMVALIGTLAMFVWVYLGGRKEDQLR